MFKCIKCSDKNFESLKQPNKELRIKCGLCNEEYEKIHKKEHMKIHEYLYNVDQLNQIVEIINNNYKLLDDNKGNKTICPVDLIHHFINHNFETKFCAELYPTKELKLHLEQLICRSYNCKSCGRNFDFNGFIHHLSKCNQKIYSLINDDAYSFRCNLCGSEFPHLNQLKEHLKCQHNKELMFCLKCYCFSNNQNHCDELAPNSNSKLNDEVNYFANFTHMENPQIIQINDGNSMFHCHVCKIKFTKFHYFQEHFVVHDVELIYCEKCFYFFDSSDDLYRHQCVEIPNNDCHDLFDDDLLDRITVLIKNLESIKFTNIKKSEKCQEINKPICVKNCDVGFDLEQILPRILEQRNKRLFNFEINDLRNDSEMEPPIKKMKIENETSNCLKEIKILIRRCDDEDEIANKRMKY